MVTKLKDNPTCSRAAAVTPPSSSPPTASWSSTRRTRMGPAGSRQDQDAHRQAGDHADQHAYARRSRERQRRVPGDGRHRRPGEHRGEHEEDDPEQHLPRIRPCRRRPSSSRTGGKGPPKHTFERQDDDGQGRMKWISFYFGRATPTLARVPVPGAPRRCTRPTSSPARTSRCSTRTTCGSAIEIANSLEKASQRAERQGTTRSSPATSNGDDAGGSGGIHRVQP